MALVLDAPVICITSSEGDTLAEPIAAICEHYGLKEVGAWMLWVHLVTAMAMVYGPRVAGLSQTKDPWRQSPPPFNPVDFAGGNLS